MFLGLIFQWLSFIDLIQLLIFFLPFKILGQGIHQKTAWAQIRGRLLGIFKMT